MIQKTTYKILLLFFLGNRLLSQNPVNESYKGFNEGKFIDSLKNGHYIKGFIKNGNLQGERSDYYKNGKLYCYQEFDNGNFNGNNYSLNTNGDTIYIENYSKDTLLYTKNFYYYKNRVLKKTYSTRYLRDSSLIINPFKNSISKEGDLWFDHSYLEKNVNNKMIEIQYYKSGNRKLYLEQSKNKYSGLYIEYYENGAIKFQTICSNNMYNGLYTSYFQNGQIKYQVTCINDKFEGEYKEYNKKGELIKTCNFKDGKELK